MVSGQWFYLFPLWLIYAATVAIIFLAFEAGFRLGKKHLRHKKYEKDTPVGPMVGATLGLLAFMLSFTFGNASSHFDARKQAVFEESNTIRSVYALARLIPEASQEKTRALLREYVNIRTKNPRTPKDLKDFVVRSEEIQRQIWDEAIACKAKDPASVPDLFIQSLNEMIDLHAKRLSVALRWNIPLTIWTLLYGITVLGISGMGYHAGLTGMRGSFAYFVLGFAFSVVLVLIADLDRPRQGLFKVNQQAMMDLQEKMEKHAF